MLKRPFKQIRSITLAAVSAIAAIFSAVSSALASSIPGPFP
jgi:hypothetical protein